MNLILVLEPGEHVKVRKLHLALKNYPSLHPIPPPDSGIKKATLTCPASVSWLRIFKYQQGWGWVPLTSLGPLTLFPYFLFLKFCKFLLWPHLSLITKSYWFDFLNIFVWSCYLCPGLTMSHTSLLASSLASSPPASIIVPSLNNSRCDPLKMQISLYQSPI